MGNKLQRLSPSDLNLLVHTIPWPPPPPPPNLLVLDLISQQTNNHYLFGGLFHRTRFSLVGLLCHSRKGVKMTTPNYKTFWKAVQLVGSSQCSRGLKFPKKLSPNIEPELKL